MTPSCTSICASRLQHVARVANAAWRAGAIASWLALSLGLAVALQPRDALAANGKALADLARSIHRMQAACERRAQPRCALLATTTPVAADGSPERTGEGAAVHRVRPTVGRSAAIVRGAQDTAAMR